MTIFRKTLATTLILGISTKLYAAEPTRADAAAVLPTINPANVMNTLDQTLPWLGSPSQTDFKDSPIVPANDQKVENNKNLTFVMKQVELVGNVHTVPLPVQKVYESAIGKELSFADVENIAAQMEQVYRDQGYILVQVILPPQKIDLSTGIVKFQIIEGQIQSVIFKGDSAGAAKRQLERYAEQLENEDPIKYQTLDRFLILANQLPGIDVTAALKPNPKIMGAADLIIDVKRAPMSEFININNRGTQYIGPGQLAVGGAVYDLFGADAFSVSGATSTSNPNQLKYSNVSYDLVV